MKWEPSTNLQKGETLGFTLTLVPRVQVQVVFYGSDGFWYSSFHIAGQRVSQHVKSLNEADAKRRAVEGARTFARALSTALDEIEYVGLENE